MAIERNYLLKTNVICEQNCWVVMRPEKSNHRNEPLLLCPLKQDAYLEIDPVSEKIATRQTPYTNMIGSIQNLR